MKSDLMPVYHQRHSIRLKGYDYSKEGAYFVTVVTQDRNNLLGEILDGQMRLNDFGKIVQNTWDDLINHNDHIELDDFVAMPNHVHGIIVITNAEMERDDRRSVSEVVRQLKTFSARRINVKRATPGVPVWQRNYYEHIIRNEDDLNRIREYITVNPMRWQDDEENPLRR